MSTGHRTRKTPCWFHETEAGCHNGDQCPFSHDTSRMAVRDERQHRRRVRQNVQRREGRRRDQAVAYYTTMICHYYTTIGCEMGDACAYYHPAIVYVPLRES